MEINSPGCERGKSGLVSQMLTSRSHKQKATRGKFGNPVWNIYFPYTLYNKNHHNHASYTMTEDCPIGLET